MRLIHSILGFVCPGAEKQDTELQNFDLKNFYFVFVLLSFGH